MIYAEALRELLVIVSAPGVPREMARSAARLSERVDLCLVVSGTGVASRGDAQAVRLEPSSAFLDYLSAARARDWGLARALEREMLAARPAIDRREREAAALDRGASALQLH